MWWIAKDVCGVLGLDNRETKRRLDEDEVGLTHIIDSIGRNQEVVIVNESGLYSLILRSRKPEAKAFKKWITFIVLPTIQKRTPTILSQKQFKQEPEAISATGKDLMAFDFNGSAVTAIIDDDGNPWWIAKDVCAILGVFHTPSTIRALDDDERGYVRIPHRSANGGNPNVSIINEPGLYSLILRSRKPEAKAFKKWITSEVLPTIRKTGKYEQEKPPLALPDFTNPAEAARVWAEQFERMFS